jgi:cation diffusion facilitator CzcD-associated flavoprotein CzcO
VTEVGIIGAGPAGLVAARYLASEGFEPVLFEQGATVGGQWSGDRTHSGIWPSMRTNTSRILTAFSDLPHADDANVYPSNQFIGEYLRAYAERFSLTSRVRVRAPVVALDRARGGRRWLVRTRSGEHEFEYVVVATGAFQRWTRPSVPGLASFSGAGGVVHTYQYRDAESLRGRRVLIGGGAISALEIASDLAMAGAASVTVTVRRQRYVLPKLAAGTPTDHIVFTRYHALAEEAFTAERVNQMYIDAALRRGGRPEHYGAPAARACRSSHRHSATRSDSTRSTSSCIGGRSIRRCHASRSLGSGIRPVRTFRPSSCRRAGSRTPGAAMCRPRPTTS